MIQPSDPRPPSRLAIFTICSNNYVAMAELLLRSAIKHHPYATTYLCLADERLSDPGFYPEGLEIITASELGIDDFDDFAFRYDVMELNTALKPFMFRRLFERGHDAVLYFDPDIEIFSELHPVLDALRDGASLVLTPHLCRPEEGPHYPNDIGVMQAGIFNLGFLGAGKGEETETLLRWWSRRLRYQCVNDQWDGLFVDQKFMDLVPAFAEKARVLRNPTLNVGYWNLQQRNLTRDANGSWRIDDAPLGFFHFSGIDVHGLSRLSRHTTAFRDDDMPAAVRELCEAYAARLIAAGHGVSPSGLYAYGRFVSGTPIPEIVRRMYRERYLLWLGGNPFETFEEFLHLPAPGVWRGSRSHVVTNLMLDLWQRDLSLKTRFDLQTRQGVRDYVDWFCHHGASHVGDARLVAPVAERVGTEVPIRRPLPAAPAGEPQVTVVGYLRTASGVGEVARKTLGALLAADIPAEGLDVSLHVLTEPNESSVDRHLVERPRAPAQIFNINADQLPHVLTHLALILRQDAYRISVPFWELAEFPAAWIPAFDRVDEIWAPTQFIQMALLRRIRGKPVLRMPVALDFEPGPALDSMSREALGLPRDDFLFFFAFDFLSQVRRKNPEAVIAAFQRAFRSASSSAQYGERGQDRRVGLVIKTLNAELAPESRSALRSALRENPDVYLIERTLTRAETVSLMSVCDAVVSLHRSEGLGLLVAEAMVLGKPVISTDYSATTELVNPGTGYPVDFRLVALQEGDYPFHEGQVWADADIGHAAWQMRRLVSDETERRRRVRAARALVTSSYNIATTSRRVAARLQELRTDARAPVRVSL